MKRLLFFLSLLALTLSFAGCGCSGALVVHAFEEESGDPVRAVEARVEEAGRSARGESSARLNDIPCRAEEYLIHVSSPDGHFEPRFARGAVQDGAVVSVEVKVVLNEAGIAAKQRDKELEGDPLGRLKHTVEKAIPR